MKQALPWNVTGIPPQARELARAAAARDGLSVGDWLTRRIYLEAQQELEETRAAPGSQNSRREAAEEAPSGRNEIMHQLARMEGATESALRRIDDTLRTLARSGEPTTSAKGKTEIPERVADNGTDSALHEQAQRIEHLARRVENVERTTDTATLRKAIRGLHQGVSRLAEQVAKNEIGTTNRIDALEGNIDAVSRSAQETRVKSGHLAKDLEERLSALTGQIEHSEELLSGLDERVQDAVSGHLFAFERKIEDIAERFDGTEHTQGQRQRSVETALKSFEERLAMIERRSQETSSDFRLSLEEMRDRLDAAERQSDAGLEDDTPATNDDSLSLPGMSQDLALGNENQTVTNAVQKFLSVARRSTNPEAGAKNTSGRLTLASSRPERTEEPPDKESAPLRRVLPILSIGLLLATGIGYWIVSGSLARSEAAAEPSRAGAPPVAAYAVEAGAATAFSDAELFSPLEGGEKLGQKFAADDPVLERSVGIDRSPLNAEQGAAAEPDEALLLYEQAARHGHLGAMHNLAVAYATGMGAEKNLAEAHRWFKSAADLGYTDSQFNLAVLYERGMGMPISLNEAYRWYLAAAGQGDSEAQIRAELLSKQLTGEQRLAVERDTTIYAAQPFSGAANEPPTLAQLQ